MVCALRRREAQRVSDAGRDHPSEASSLRMFYEAREIKPYAEHVNADRLEEGAVYFSCMFLDDGETGSPVLEPLVFIGRNLLPEDVHGIETTVYFQDAHSYLRGAATTLLFREFLCHGSKVHRRGTQLGSLSTSVLLTS